VKLNPAFLRVNVRASLWEGQTIGKGSVMVGWSSVGMLLLKPSMIVAMALVPALQSVMFALVSRRRYPDWVNKLGQLVVKTVVIVAPVWLEGASIAALGLAFGGVLSGNATVQLPRAMCIAHLFPALSWCYMLVADQNASVQRGTKVDRIQQTQRRQGGTVFGILSVGAAALCLRFPLLAWLIVYGFATAMPIAAIAIPLLEFGQSGGHVPDLAAQRGAMASFSAGLFAVAAIHALFSGSHVPLADEGTAIEQHSIGGYTWGQLMSVALCTTVVTTRAAWLPLAMATAAR
jgi:hypothetical protein